MAAKKKAPRSRRRARRGAGGALVSPAKASGAAGGYAVHEHDAGLFTIIEVTPEPLRRGRRLSSTWIQAQVVKILVDRYRAFQKGAIYAVLPNGAPKDYNRIAHAVRDLNKGRGVSYSIAEPLIQEAKQRLRRGDFRR